MSSVPQLPKTHRALVQSTYAEPPTVQILPTPQPTAGSAVVRVLAAGVVSYMREIYNGTRKYPYPTPMVLGTSAIGRVAAIGPDTASLHPGQLVFVDPLIRARDNPGIAFLAGIHQGGTEGSAKLMHGEWRDWTYADFAKVPLENCEPLDERRLLGEPGDGGLGYKVEELPFMAACLVPYGGLRDIYLKAGETVIISPATGQFGGAAVMVALAMGARVIALGRNADALQKVKQLDKGRVEIVQITSDVQADAESLKKYGPADAFLDISPPAAAKSTHIKSGIFALRHGGRVSLMGGIMEDVPIPHSRVMHWNLQIKGKWMYEREDIGALVKLVEAGLLRLDQGAGVTVMGAFPLEEWEKAFDAAAENSRAGQHVVITPQVQ